MHYALGELTPDTQDACFIAPNATIIGQVKLAEDVSIWFNTVIRADMDKINIGPRSNIQDGCILHVDQGFPMAIGADVTVGHKVMLHGCNIGDGSLVGMNAVIMNGAIIGKGCLIGANTLIPENMQIPDGSLVLGSPGKISKTLDAKTRDMLLQSAKHYVQNGTRYDQDLVNLTPVI